MCGVQIISVFSIKILHDIFMYIQIFLELLNVVFDFFFKKGLRGARTPKSGTL
jgi:hypothetical protein